MGLNFSLSSVPTVEGISSIVTYISWYRRRSPGDGQTAALGEDEDGPGELVAVPTHDAQLHQVERHSMAVKGRIIAQTGNAKQLGLISHACHLLS